jgi:hypothetical protein
VSLSRTVTLDADLSSRSLRLLMRKFSITAICSLAATLLTSCSPRDFLTRRLASDLVATSHVFRATQQFRLRTGIISNDDYVSPEYAALQHHGWISATNAACPLAISPSPCWDVSLTPSGVDTFQTLITPSEAARQSFTLPAARRELIAITGIARQANIAEVEFTWKWHALNEVGAALYPGSVRYRSAATFRHYDDGWRIVESASHPNKPLDEALRDAEPAQ